MGFNNAREELSVLAAFAVVADERSFTRAAVRLGVVTVSHAISGLEERLGVLLARTTQRRGDGGGSACSRNCAGLDDIAAALTEVGRLRERPAGTIRLIAPPIAVAMTVSAKLAQFTRDYPDVVLDITTEDDSRRDLIAGRFDAGIHLGEFVQKDMVAVKVTAPQRAAIVGAPSYFASHPKPKTPRDLTAHRCIRYRMGAEGPVYRWEFEKGKLSVSVSGPLINDVEITRAPRGRRGARFALEGVGSASLAGSSCGSSRIGARPSTASSCITRAGVNSRRHFRRSSRRSECENASFDIQTRAIRPSPTSTLAPPTLTSVIASGVPEIRMCTRLGLSIFTP